MDAMRILVKTEFRQSLFGYVEMGAPWSVRLPDQDAAVLHVVTQGRTWLKAIGAEHPILLEEHDAVLLPRGAAHLLGSDADPRSEISWEGLLRRKSCGTYDVLRAGGNGATTSFTSAVCHWSRAGKNVVAEALPEVMVVPNGQALLAGLLDQIRDETRRNRESSPLIINHFLNVAVLEILERVLHGAPKENPWVRGLQNPAIARAISLIHSKIDERWTAASLARRVGMSRSAFIAKFSDAIGRPPGEYISDMRMNEAAVMLREEDEDICSIAERVGYESGVAFSRAFKRRFGATPGGFRRETAPAA